MSKTPSYVAEFYKRLCKLGRPLDGKELYRQKCFASRKMNCWPKGVLYFFLNGVWEQGDSQFHPRVVRVGITGTMLGKRIRQHMGNTTDGSGSHANSAFRRLVADALERCPNPWKEPSGFEQWGVNTIIRLRERGLELSGVCKKPDLVKKDETLMRTAVSDYVRSLPFLWVEVPNSKQRSDMERSAIRLLSMCENIKANQASRASWMGKYNKEGPNGPVARSGLWNVDHVCEAGYRPADDEFCEFLKALDKCIHITRPFPSSLLGADASDP